LIRGSSGRAHEDRSAFRQFRGAWRHRSVADHTGRRGLGRRTGRRGLAHHLFQLDEFWPAEAPTLEVHTSLGYLAGQTERIKLVVLVSGATYRHPGLLAKTATTLDVLSRGRAVVGLGGSW
jgi:alkanesulfonate monooxygenase SsuD/methylene tetrahydromethanopterin reductase-like flavin-dependent oxidoreductase (luciferase family)